MMKLRQIFLVLHIITILSSREEILIIATRLETSIEQHKIDPAPP